MAARKRSARKKTTKADKTVDGPQAEPEEPTGRPGRPAIEWNDKAVRAIERLALKGNTVEDMASILEVGKRTLERAIATEYHPVRHAYERGRAHRRNNLRTWQYQTARGGNATMQIWLGKQDLGQRDVKAVELTGEQGGPIGIEGSHDVGQVLEERIVALARSRQTKPPPKGPKGNGGANGSTKGNGSG